jgi:murein DD-endopeptidase MepM/ murein hydrolase activator NlpD
MIRAAAAALALASALAAGATAATSALRVVVPEVRVGSFSPPTPRGPLPGDSPRLLPPSSGPLLGVPQIVTPPLGGGPYVFPVYGPAPYVDSYGELRGAVSWEHGDDILGELGQPLLAVADGTVFSVGWSRDGGNRLRLRDHQGNLFYYAHLAAFSTSVRNGARVHAGEVIGFMGDTGSSEGQQTRLHFEIHPVSMLYLGNDSSVDPTTYLRDFRRLRNLPFPVATGWAPSPRGVVRAPAPGAMLIGVTDIASGGLGAARR